MNFYKRAMERAASNDQKARIFGKFAAAYEVSGSGSKALQNYHKALELSADSKMREVVTKKIEALTPK